LDFAEVDFAFEGLSFVAFDSLAFDSAFGYSAFDSAFDYSAFDYSAFGFLAFDLDGTDCGTLYFELVGLVERAFDFQNQQQFAFPAYYNSAVVADEKSYYFHS
jgi:hypothetical protein